MTEKPSDAFSDDELLYMVIELDRELFKAGYEIKRRQVEVNQRLMRRFGYQQFIFAGKGKMKILERIEDAFVSIYRRQDVAMGGHIGVFMYRDTFARISVPHIYGTVQIDPFKFVELNPLQLRILTNEPVEMGKYLDQFFDVMDVEYGIDELRAPFSKNESVKKFLQLARLQLHAAAAILTGGYDYRGAAQSSLLATELALKAGAAAQGLDERTLQFRPYGHDRAAIAKYVSKNWRSCDWERVERVLASQPDYVKNRYAREQPARVEVGSMIMGAQFIVAEIVRQISNRNFRAAFNPPLARTYP